MIAVLRSILFNIYYVLCIVFFGTILLPVLPFHRRWIAPLIRFWLLSILMGARVLCGIRWRIEGRENLPEGACILASKHQSAWETFFFHTLVPDPVYVLKRELLRIPFVGWYMQGTQMIAVDRSAGAAALKQVLREAEPALLSEHRQLVIFPEGTRVLPGTSAPWQPGVVALYNRFGKQVPVLPVALNSGVFWPRNSFMKKPGEIVVRILPPMPTDLDKKAFAQELESRIETACHELCVAAGVTPPQGSEPPCS